MAAVANSNSSSTDLHNVLRTTEKYAYLVTNSRHRIIRPPSSLLIDEKEKIGGQKKEELAQYYSPRTSNSLTSAKKKFDVGGAIQKGLLLATKALLYPLLFVLRFAAIAIFYPLSFLLQPLFPDFLNTIGTILFILGIA